MGQPQNSMYVRVFAIEPIQFGNKTVQLFVRRHYPPFHDIEND